MVVSKKEKCVKQRENPQGKHVGQRETPENYYGKNPSWNFASCDTEMWPFSEDNAGSFFWDEILPHLKGWESQTWSDILISAKKQNHPVDVSSLNSLAKKRLAEKFIEQETLISLRLNGTHRIYGYMNKAVFNILWFDTTHGDNADCVCRSHKKHT